MNYGDEVMKSTPVTGPVFYVMAIDCVTFVWSVYVIKCQSENRKPIKISVADIKY